MYSLFQLQIHVLLTGVKMAVFAINREDANVLKDTMEDTVN
jgi:hypothetical protein